MYQNICESCEAQILSDKHEQEMKAKVKQSQKYGITPKISAGFLNQLSLELRFPFQSVSLLVDCAVLKKSSLFEIRIHRIEECESHDTEQIYQQNYVQMKFDCAITDQQVIKFCQSQTENNLLSRWLKLGILGLGKTGVIVSNDGNDLKVMVFSIDDRINSSFYQTSQGIYYIENIQNKYIKNFSGNLMKSVIFQSFKILHLNPDKILDCPPNMTCIYVFHPRIFVMSNKVMVYEILESNFGRDIDVHHNHQKIQLLNKIGYQMSNHAEFRLSNYLSLLYKSPQIKLKISETEQPVQLTPYLDYLRLLQKNGMITKIVDPKIYGATFAELYETKHNYFGQNNGILLYSKGRLINRHGTQFGTMIDDCFFKKKYKKPAKNIWRFLGVIQLNEQIIKPNIVRTKFISNIYYHKFIKDIRSITLKADKKTPISSAVGDQSEDNRSIRNPQQADQFDESDNKKGPKPQHNENEQKK